MFACVCAQKSVEFGLDKKLHRAIKDQQLQGDIAALLPASDAETPSTSGCAAFQTGGGMRTDGEHPDLSLASLDTCVAVFLGHLDNAADLVRKCSGSTPSATVGSGSLAELVCRLYVAHGVELLSMLRGTFSLCLYESKTARVLASSDVSGGTTLFEGRTTSGDLIVASSRDYLTGCTDVVPFQPGDYKYGWHAPPRQYDRSEFASDAHGRRMAASSRRGHEHPHHGLGNGSCAARRRTEEQMAVCPASAGPHRRSDSATSYAVEPIAKSAEKPQCYRPPGAVNGSSGLTASRLANVTHAAAAPATVKAASNKRRPVRSPSSTSASSGSQDGAAGLASTFVKSIGMLDASACPFTPTRSSSNAVAPQTPSPAPVGVGASSKALKKQTTEASQQLETTPTPVRKSAWVSKSAAQRLLAAES